MNIDNISCLTLDSDFKNLIIIEENDEDNIEDEEEYCEDNNTNE